MSKKKIIRQNDPSLDPFGFLAKNLEASSVSDEVWEEKPVEIEEFVNSPHFLNQKWDPVRFTGCRPKIMQALKGMADENVREAILLLGKGCIAGDSRIMTTKGQIQISKLVDKEIELYCFDPNDPQFRLTITTGICVAQGEQPIFEIITANNKQLNLTDDHLMFTKDGWKELKSIFLLDCEVAFPDVRTGAMKWTKITRWRFAGKKQTYDIKCDGMGLQNFVANGLYVHNSGKDYGSSVFHLYGIYRCLCMKSPQLYHGLSANSAIYFVNTARNERQAQKVFFAEFKGMLKACQWFEGKYDEPGRDSIRFDKGIEALSANSQAFGWLGYNVLQWVGDELAFFLEEDKDEENAASRAEECWQAAYGSCQTRFTKHYKMIGITTPRDDNDFVMTKYRELEKRMLPDAGVADAFVMTAATWDVNPKITIEDFKHEFERDPKRTWRDFGAKPMGVVESFWPDTDFIDKNVCDICKACPVYQNRKTNQNNYACYDYDDCKANMYRGNGQWRFSFQADPNADYFMHFDLSINKDRVGFALGHRYGETKIQLDGYQIKKLEEQKKSIPEDYSLVRPLIKLDAVGFISPKDNRDQDLLKNGEVWYDAVLQRIIYPLRAMGFNVSKITTDQFQSHHFRQALQDRNFQTDLISMDRTDEIPVAARTAFLEGRVYYPYCRLFVDEARNLKYIRARKVDHKSSKSKDIWDGVAGTIWNCENFENIVGTYIVLE